MNDAAQPETSYNDRSTQRPGAMRRLGDWGITEIVDDYRGAKLTQSVAVSAHTVEIHKVRPAFTVECLDCGSAPHVTPDDATIAVCLRCGRDRWL